MAKDLKLTVGERYSIITLVFFVPYSQSRFLSLRNFLRSADRSPAYSHLRTAVQLDHP